MLTWDPSSICLCPSTLDVRTIAMEIYDRTCRTDFDAPGFCTVNARSTTSSIAFRQLMIDLRRAMATIHESRARDALTYLSAARFDQQVSTKPHLDGGPDECFLMLGYEPSEVRSELEILDYAKCAFDLGMSPQEFMAQHNPMFKPGRDLLRSYSMRIPCFSATDYQVVCINNSSAPYSPSCTTWQGVLHAATILTPDESKRRIINSIMVARAQPGTQDAITSDALEQFIHTTEVRRRGYDKIYLADDE